MKPAIVITGASSGIGRALAAEAAGDAAAIILVGLDRAKLAETASACSGLEAHLLALDLVDHDAGAKIEAVLQANDLYCDILVNSAGFGMYGAAAELARDQQLQLIDVNIRAVTDLSLRFLPGMLQRGRGGIINIASITAYTAGPYMALYFASKSFVKSFTLALASETAGSGVTITCLIPGVARTPFFDACDVENNRLYKMVPRSDTPRIARAAWRGFKAGRYLVIPRLADRMVTIICELTPRWLMQRVVATLQRPRGIHDGAAARADTKPAQAVDHSGQPAIKR